MSTFRLLALYCLVREGGRTIFINFCTSSNIAYHVNLPLTISVKIFSSRNITYPPQPPGSPDIVFTCFYMFLHVFICAYMFLLPQVIGFFLLQVTPDRRLWELEVIIIRVRL